jgi:hypothetical protein
MFVAVEGRVTSKVFYAIFVFDLALNSVLGLLILLLVRSSGLLGCTLPKIELLLSV